MPTNAGRREIFNTNVTKSMLYTSNSEINPFIAFVAVMAKTKAKEGTATVIAIAAPMRKSKKVMVNPTIVPIYHM